MLFASRCLSVLVMLAVIGMHAHAATISAQVEVKHAGSRVPSKGGNDNVVVWLTPVTAPARVVPTARYRLTQKNKQFHPHVLVVPVGAEVEFPNEDPFFHNVFSLYKGKRFDLGLYEAGSSRAMRFERPGVSFIFCNIHPQMSAYILALQTPYFGTSDERGQVAIPGVPPGAYRLEVWYERAESSELNALSRAVTVGPADTSLGILQVRESEHSVPPHRDKHGQPYENERTPY